MVISFFFILVIILIIIGILAFRKGYGLLFLLVFFCPTITVTDQDRGERSAYHIQKMAIANPLYTCIDLIVEFTGHHHGLIFNGGESYYDMFFIVELYSVFLMGFLHVVLRRFRWVGLRSNFTLYAKIFYAKIYFWGPVLACGIGILLLTDVEARPISNFHFSRDSMVYQMCYLIAYFVMLTFLMRQYFFLAADEKFVVLFLVLLFPVTGFSGDYKAIVNIGIETYSRENHVALYPLVYALPKTIISFFSQWHVENFILAKAPALYSMFQCVVVLYLFPSLFNVNNEDKKLRGIE